MVGSVLVMLSPIDYALVEPARLTGKVLVWKYVRLITPWVNIYAFIFLVGGAIHSALQYRKDGQSGKRFWGNILIALGGLLPGIGGSFTKDDIEGIVAGVNAILPENKPRHLLGIGEPSDLFAGIEAGIDLFDCVAPTRIARNGALYTKKGKINILNAKFISDFSPIEDDCACYTCKHYTRAYLAHLFRSKELFGLRLASIHNVYFIVSLVENIRQAILEERFNEYKTTFLKDFSG
jgi:tRNA-guanine family transglycosylase